MTSSLHLCLNCLDVGAAPFKVGPDEGSQRDPVRRTIDLCPVCRDLLHDGDLPAFHARFTERRTVER